MLHTIRNGYSPEKLLHLMELPVGRDMDGKVLAFAGDAAEIAYVDTHEREGETREVKIDASEHDAAIMEKLKALGYID